MHNKKKLTSEFKKKSKDKKNKIHLVFDENKRKEFLTGFHKRKLQRKKEAKEKFERDLKEERKRIKAEAKESYKKLIVSHKPIPELENLLSEKYEDEDVLVKVVELSTNDLVKQNNWIGNNTTRYKDEEVEASDTEEQIQSEIPGMELKQKPPQSKKKEIINFNNEKDVKKALKKQATKNVKKSKVFQKKNKMESQKQRNKSLRVKRQNLKIRDKKEKGKKGSRRKGNAENN